ncbi:MULTISPECIES: quinone-dependent dihydroorotate dehydrogenase [Haloferax]|uniref:Dihydroorotate dehydrogenase (quinone) n=2 Tax=Haloferax TaxID=2251 RepID=A0A6G1YZZ9_9EURY|nr:MULTISPECIES: quinone-dependent dihydroorotate dehydrogenase [Haloferax]KAB1187212.1 quinone-dependent dihydroorotate dehydrogenase [Haloferax sp. CBA1149]MRW79852.1 quinone-dependent dihydroorotate dehydrogenase [Haloferax marinisediminis]
MNPYQLAKPVLFSLPPETAHRTIHGLLQSVRDTPVESFLEHQYRVDDPRLSTTAFGLDFPNPVGVAAGFDKNAEIPTVLAALGFGHIEVGGVTAKPQSGNSRPRMFRLPEDEALINRMGLNNEGADAVGERLSTGPRPDVPLGVNLALSEVTDTEDAPEDYLYTYERVADGADYFVVNVSCPNSEGFRDLQNRDSLEAILGTLVDAGADPLLVKLSPDLPDPAVEDALEVVDDLSLDGIIASNTTTSRPDSLQNANQAERGGLSGKPIENSATEMIRFIADRSDVPIIGVGGVSDAEGAYQKIRAGASMVQLYTGMIYEGPSIARDINRGLLDRLERDGFDSIEDAVGVDR